MKKVIFSLMIVVLFSQNIFSDENVLKCDKKTTLDELNRKNGDALVCYMLKAKKDFKTLIEEKVLCQGVGLEEYSSLMNYLPIFNLSFIKKVNVGYGYKYIFKINSINHKKLSQYKNTSVKIKNGVIVYKSNGMNLNFRKGKTMIGTAYLPDNKEQMCIWLD